MCNSDLQDAQSCTASHNPGLGDNTDSHDSLSTTADSLVKSRGGTDSRRPDQHGPGQLVDDPKFVSADEGSGHTRGSLEMEPFLPREQGKK